MMGNMNMMGNMMMMGRRMTMMMMFMSLIAPMCHSDVTCCMVRMMSMSDSMYYSFESYMWCWRIFNNSVGTISFFQRVSPMNIITMTRLILRFVVVRVGIMYTVFEFILDVTLKMSKRFELKYKGYLGGFLYKFWMQFCIRQLLVEIVQITISIV